MAFVGVLLQMHQFTVIYIIVLQLFLHCIGQVPTPMPKYKIFVFGLLADLEIEMA